MNINKLIIFILTLFLLNLNYVWSEEKINLDEMAKKIINGHNLNEVVLTTKKTENKTFFEKFFHFFS